jgi:predicted enzyme related to lactoylglutathione lyase
MFNQLIAFSSFSSNDISKAREFYEGTLGLDVEDSMGVLRVKFHLGNELFIYLKPDHQAAAFTVLNFKVDDIKDSVKQLKDKGVEFEHYDNLTNEDGIAGTDERAMGPIIAWFKDPAGNILSVLQDRE